MTRAAFFDLDGTLTTDRVWRGIMHYVTQIEPQRLNHALFWSKHMPRYLAFKAGLLSSVAFRELWAADLTWFYRGLAEAKANEINAWITKHYVVPMLRDDSRKFVDHHLAAGDLVMLVSSGPQHLLRRIGQELGVYHAVGTPFEAVNGRYTGRLSGPVCIADRKPAMARAYLAERGYEVDLSASHAYADSASDIELLRMVGHPTAVYPDAALWPTVQAEGWPVFPEGYTPDGA